MGRYAAVQVALTALVACSLAGCKTPWDSTSSTAGGANVPAGCGTLPGGTTNGSVMTGAVRRTYVVHVPRGLPRARHPLVMAFHGFGGSGAEMARLTGLNGLAHRYGFIAVYPSGRKNPGAAAYWADDDMPFIGMVLRTFSSRLCVDPGRVYATGFSAGGALSYQLACFHSGYFAAIAPVEGVVPPTFPASCRPRRPVSVLIIHARADTAAPYAGAFQASLPPIPSVQRAWARLDGCRSTPVQFLKRKEVLATRFSGCRAGTVVELYTLAHGGHQWPGSHVKAGVGPISTAVDATRLVWSFFASHPRR